MQVRDIFHLLDAAKNQDTHALWYHQDGALSFTLDVNVKDNLWIHCVRGVPRPTEDRQFPMNWLWHVRMSKPDGLTIHDFSSLMRPPWQDSYGKPDSAASARRLRMHSLLVHAAEKAVNGYTDMLRSRYQPNWPGARVMVCHEDGIPVLKIAFRLSNEWNVHPAMVLTGLDRETLVNVVPRLAWRTPTEAEASKWVAEVLRAGGEDPSSKAPDRLAKVVDFYQENDPETIAQREREQQERRRQEQQAAEAEAAAKRRAVEDAVREVLKASDTGHGAGWRQAVATAAGIPVQKVKPWLQQRLPEEFARIYGTAAGRP